MALTDNLSAYWKLDEASGNAADSSGNGNTMTNVATVTYVSGIIGNAAQFNGSSEYFTALDSVSLSPTGDMSIQAWMNLPSLPTNGNQWDIVSKSGAFRCWRFMYQRQGGTLQFGANISQDGTNNAGSPTWNTSLSTSTWYHIVWTFTAASHTSEIWQNASSLGTADAVATAIYDSAELTYMGAVNASPTYPGKLDEVALWKRVLSSSEISQLYNSGAGLQYPFVTDPGDQACHIKNQDWNTGIFLPATIKSI